MPEIDENVVPEDCPGVQSERAGKESACAGCPNQQVCSSGAARAPDPDLPRIEQRMSAVRHKVLILSGKGGVGKSTVSSMLARTLSLDPNRNVALLDIDICGPSLPRIMGLEGEGVHQSGSGWSPVFVEENLSVMSVGFLLSSPDDAVIWRGPRKNGLIKQFLRDVDWGSSVDYLLVDTPPGTSDEHLSIVQYLKSSNIDGAVIVTTSQEVALLDVRKEINFCRKVGVPLIGVVENMTEFVCPKCHKSSTIFPSETGGAELMCQQMNAPFLGRLPLDTRVARCCDEGVNFINEHSDSETARQYVSVTSKLVEFCENAGNSTVH